MIPGVSNLIDIAEDELKDLLMKQIQKLVEDSLPKGIPQQVIDSALKDAEKGLDDVPVFPAK
ncbi:MAG: hypothetical protein EBZ48_16015 [Proteobacteria bacterium]|nr:hypothetical protein [Pseudomonadota bacterium]